MFFLLLFLLSFLGTKSVFSAFLLAFLGHLIHFYWKVSKYPKGPFPYPIVGNLFHITPLQMHNDFEKYRKIYGDVFTLWLFGAPMVVLNREEAFKEALVTKADIFLNRTGDFPEPIFQTTENGGIIFSSGENWREQRRSTLHILRDFGVGKNVMEQQIHEQLEQFTERLRKIEDKGSVDLRWPIQVLIANVINNLLFGYSYSHEKCDRLMSYALEINSVLAEMFESIFIVVIQLFPFALHFPYIGHQAAGRHVQKLRNCLDFVKEDVKNSLANYSKEEEPNCVAQAYFQKMDTNPTLDMDNLYNVCSDFFMAGMETTSTTLRWAVLYLAGYQDVQDKIRKEIGDVVGFNRLPSLRDRMELPFTVATITEIQRVTNIVPLNLQRRNTQDVTVCGKLIPAGTNCVPQVYSCLVDDRYFPQPEKFDPMRFILEDGSLDTELMSHVVPFGMGKRQCAGESLARAELFLSLATIVQRFHLYPKEGTKIDFSPLFGTVLNPKTNLLRIQEVISY